MPRANIQMLYQIVNNLIHGIKSRLMICLSLKILLESNLDIGEFISLFFNITKVGV